MTWPPICRAGSASCVVSSTPGDRIHFLDWGGPPSGPGVVLVHGLAQTRLVLDAGRAPACRGRATVVAMDLRGHGLSDAPTGRGYDLDELRGDVVAVAEGSGAARRDGSVVLAGHGFGAIVAAAAAARLGDRCAGSSSSTAAGDVAEATGDGRRRVPARPRRAARGHALDARLPRRPRGIDPATWDADQERAARAAVVETPAGTSCRRPGRTRSRPASGRCSRTGPADVLPQVDAPIIVVVRRRRRPGDEDDAGVGDARRRPAPASSTSRRAGHNLMRYRPDEVTAAILGRLALVARADARRLQPGPPRPRHRRPRRPWASVIPANEVAERAERIRAALEADGGFTIEAPTEHGKSPITRRPRSRASCGSSRSPGRRRGRQAIGAAVPRRRHVSRTVRMFEGMCPEFARLAARDRLRRRSGRLVGPRHGEPARAPGRTSRRGPPSTSR